MRDDGNKEKEREKTRCASRYFIRRTIPRIHILKDFKGISAKLPDVRLLATSHPLCAPRLARGGDRRRRRRTKTGDAEEEKESLDVMLEFVRGLSAGKYHVTHLLNSRLSNGEAHNSPLVNWRAFSRQLPVCQRESATTSLCFSSESNGVGSSTCVSSPTAKNACCEILRLFSYPISLSVATVVSAYKYCISRKERNKRTNPRK